MIFSNFTDMDILSADLIIVSPGNFKKEYAFLVALNIGPLHDKNGVVRFTAQYVILKSLTFTAASASLTATIINYFLLRRRLY